MRVKKEYLILVVLIIALSSYVILRNPDRTHYQLPQLPVVDQKAVSKIEISKADESIVLEKKNDQWRIAPQGYLASDDAVSNMLDAIEHMTVTALVSESKSYERYDLNNDKKITVRVWTGDQLKREFDVGKAASSFRHTFVRLADDDRVYHVRSDLRRKFDQTTDHLRDKTVLSFAKDDIQEIRLADGKEPAVILSRVGIPVEVDVEKPVESPDAPSTPVSPPTETSESEIVWQAADGKRADKAQIDKLLNTLLNLRCDTYLDDKKKEDLSNPIYSVQLKGVEQYTLSIFDKNSKEDENYPAVSSANEYPFLLRQWQVNNIMKKPEMVLEKKKADKSDTTVKKP